MKTFRNSHVIFFSLLPVITLYSGNQDLLDPLLALPAVGACLLTGILIWAFFSLFTRNRSRSALLASVAILFFFSFGYLFTLLSAQKQVLVPVSPGRLLLVEAFAFTLILTAFFRLPISMDWVRRLFNTTGALALFLSVSMAMVSGLRSAEGQTLDIPAIQAHSGKRTNIVLIILDAYGRSDVLKEIYHFDNSAFLNHLEGRGFHTFKNSRSNYGQTLLSLVSMLNMRYVNAADKSYGGRSQYQANMQHSIRHSAVRSFLNQNGYKFIAFSSGYEGTEIRSADRYITSSDLNEFNAALFQTTPVPYLLNRIAGVGISDLYRRDLLLRFTNISLLEEESGPFFAFIHILSPHPPFLFKEDGSPENRFPFTGDGSHALQTMTRDEYVQAYRAQISFTTDRIKDAIDRLVSQKGKDTAIVLMSDHGPGSQLNWEDVEHSNGKERLSNLIAIYLPENSSGITGRAKPDEFPEEMTPVNIFPFVFNRIFATEIPFLPNKSYMSSFDRPLRFFPAKPE